MAIKKASCSSGSPGHQPEIPLSETKHPPLPEQIWLLTQLLIPAPQNCSVPHTFALFVVKDPPVPAEQCPCAFYLHLFNCQPQRTRFPLSPVVPLSAPCLGSLSIPSPCSPLFLKEGPSPHHCPTCAAFSQSLWSGVGSGLQTQLFSKGNI